MALEVVMVKKPPEAREFWEAMLRIVPRAMVPTLIKARARAPRRTSKLASSMEITVRPVKQGLIHGVSGAIVTRAPYGHLVVRGHRIVARGPQRKDRQLSRTERRTLRIGLKTRRAAGAIGLVPANPFAARALAEDLPNITRIVEKLIATEALRVV